MSADNDDRAHNICSIKFHFVRSKCVFIKLQYYGRRFSENSAQSRWSRNKILSDHMCFCSIIWSVIGLYMTIFEQSRKETMFYSILTYNYCWITLNFTKQIQLMNIMDIRVIISIKLQLLHNIIVANCNDYIRKILYRDN